MLWNQLQFTKPQKYTSKFNLFGRTSNDGFDTILTNAHHTILESISDGVLILDTDNTVISCNPSARSIVRSLLPQLDTDQLDNSYIDSLLSIWPTIGPFLSSTRGHSTSIESKVQGIFRCFDINIMPILDHEGTFTGRIVLIKETTERENAAKALRQRKQQLQLMVERLQILDRKRTSNFNTLDTELRRSLTRIDLLLNNLRKGIDEGLNDAINRLEHEISGLYARVERTIDHRHSFEVPSEASNMTNKIPTSLSGVPTESLIQLDR